MIPLSLRAPPPQALKGKALEGQGRGNLVLLAHDLQEIASFPFQGLRQDASRTSSFALLALKITRFAVFDNDGGQEGT